MTQADGPRPSGNAHKSVAQVLASHHDRFLRFVERRVARRAVAEEILQDAFVRGIARAGTLRDGESAVAWFYQLLRTTLVDHFRHAGIAQRGLTAVAAHSTAAVPAADDDGLYRALCDCAGDTLATLKPEYAAALRIVDLDEGTLSALADAAGINLGNAAVRLHRARQALRKRLEEICGGCARHACLNCTCRL